MKSPTSKNVRLDFFEGRAVDLACVENFADLDTFVHFTPDMRYMHMGKRVWDRAPVPPLYAIDRPVLPYAGKAPPCRLVRLNKRITRQDRPAELYFDANVLTWRGEWQLRPTGVVTGPSRLAYIWASLPVYPEWREVRQRIRLAAQLGTYITAELPEGYR